MLNKTEEHGTSALVDLYQRAPVEISAGEGSYLIGTDGERYLDFGTGIAVNTLGHGHPKLLNRLAQQAQAVWHCSNKFHIRSQIECAEILQQASFADRVFFCNSGAEANEGAIKMMRRHQFANGRPERWHCITFEGAFHGRTLATLSATGRQDFQVGFGPAVPGFVQAKFNDLASVEHALTPETGGILLEPIQGEGGVRVFDPGFVRELRALSAERGILLLFDEIQTGVGRTGTFLACEQFNVTPDIVSLAKGLGGGVPIGAVLCCEAVARSMVPGSHGTTFGGNPLGCAIAAEVISVVLSDGFLPRVREMGRMLGDGLDRLVAGYPEVLRERRGRGLLQGLQTRTAASSFERACLEHGLIVMAAADSVVRLLPPLTVSAEEISAAIEILEDVCRECF
ncbi:aspartate aminotransferase family protein [Breoghania sp.]|uniref:aspartate aminotransferase family protein n=1 Tax=Breoghania sp. TaxID=2065378 RepID=UPI002AA6DE98|nr:aspartate aminotransferase family protein [Breoghania sp.]